MYASEIAPKQIRGEESHPCFQNRRAVPGLRSMVIQLGRQRVYDGVGSHGLLVYTVLVHVVLQSASHNSARNSGWIVARESSHPCLRL
jgi:hypothetical protein